jgi:hypothetical protein
MAPSDWEASWVLDDEDAYDDDYGTSEDLRSRGSGVRLRGDP